ncbi:hypothetical protein RZ64_06275 [[Haemophilus] ducreyi]|uniref:Uncharacterized protein n=1 Tax=Haemophilus ducreyi (strain 35000HP / ATCC 700724) TaxID=233412 RepID=Q7VL71_HAEDU|nr:hypothetical protein [[Haemophilus] ducreyi]AAP96388.1 hypothetical protein HD_1610 [[Haemophilus] ducreyi 35000HP]AKO41554.1 hypothetical protein RZ64_06275 [[Haemophilus] ducreyi]
MESKIAVTPLFHTLNHSYLKMVATTFSAANETHHEQPALSFPAAITYSLPPCNNYRQHQQIAADLAI